MCPGDSPADAGFVGDKTAVLGDTMKEASGCVMYCYNYVSGSGLQCVGCAILSGVNCCRSSQAAAPCSIVCHLEDKNVT